MATESKVCVQDLACTLHAVERVPSDNPGTPAQFVPTRFIFTNKLGRHDKLLLAFDALVLSETLGLEVVLGKITHGEDFVTIKVKTSVLESEVRSITAKIAALISDKKPPDLVLNRHCPECEFRDSCRQKAVETDDLSLLAGISEDERNRHRSKGIFTVAQLSYTFRPRRTPKRAKKPARPRYPALQALAIRENTVFVHGSPRLPDSKTQVYLDIEGLPDNESYYLLGALIVTEGEEAFHSFWASDASQEPGIFGQFAETVANLPDFRVLHFGDYETVALKRMKAKLPESVHPSIDAILERATNVLSVIHPHVYFPTYSNGLKDIGRFLGFERADVDATGLQSIIWRKSWNANRAPDIKALLLRYNEDDCRTLKRIFESIRGLIAPESTIPTGLQTPFKTTHTKELINDQLPTRCQVPTYPLRHIRSMHSTSRVTWPSSSSLTFAMLRFYKNAAKQARRFEIEDLARYSAAISLERSSRSAPRESFNSHGAALLAIWAILIVIFRCLGDLVVDVLLVFIVRPVADTKHSSAGPCQRSVEHKWGAFAHSGRPEIPGARRLQQFQPASRNAVPRHGRSSLAPAARPIGRPPNSMSLEFDLCVSLPPFQRLSNEVPSPRPALPYQALRYV
jgi:predicted RecB family nuclease